MKLKLTNVRIDFTNGFVAKEYEPGDGKFRFSATALVKEGDANFKAINDAILTEAKAKFGDKWQKLLEGMKGNTNKYCFVDGDSKTSDRHAGYWVLSSHRRKVDGLPGLFSNKVDPSTNKVAVLAPDSGVIYDGCYVNMTVDIYAQTGTNPGIRSTFIAAQYAGEGDAFSSSRPNADDFEPVEGAEAEDIT